jgi:Bacteriophage CI repressor helix-turn-helix domain
MSSEKQINLENNGFAERFIEVCDSSQPIEIARLLNISYQAAKNYLQGRLPEARVLITISEQTAYSIHWLLTGRGEKFITISENEDTLILSDQIRDFVRQICLETINEVMTAQKDSTQPKSVILTSKNIMEEKILDESSVFSGKQQ